MAKGTFNIGDVVRQTSTFLRSIGMYSGAPINGVVVDFVKGLKFPVVFWSNSRVSPINPANLEIHKAGQAAMTPGIRASVVAEGKAKYAASVAKQQAEDDAYDASPEGLAYKAKRAAGGGILRDSLRGNPGKGKLKGAKKNPGTHFLVVLQDLPPGSVNYAGKPLWRAATADKVVESLAEAKRWAQHYADDYVDSQAKSDWRYRAAVYPSDARGIATTERAVLTVYPSKARAAAKDKAYRIEEATRRHDYEALAKLQGWGRKPRAKKTAKANPFYKASFATDANKSAVRKSLKSAGYIDIRVRGGSKKAPGAYAQFVKEQMPLVRAKGFTVAASMREIGKMWRARK